MKRIAVQLELDRLAKEDKEKIERLRRTTPCKRCGHLISAHSRYIDGRFIGCQIKGCDCEKFEWEYENGI